MRRCTRYTLTGTTLAHTRVEDKEERLKTGAAGTIPSANQPCHDFSRLASDFLPSRPDASLLDKTPPD
jgi:hypothetical protein